MIEHFLLWGLSRLPEPENEKQAILLGIFIGSALLLALIGILSEAFSYRISSSRFEKAINIIMIVLLFASFAGIVLSILGYLLDVAGIFG